MIIPSVKTGVVLTIKALLIFKGLNKHLYPFDQLRNHQEGQEICEHPGVSSLSSGSK